MCLKYCNINHIHQEEFNCSLFNVFNNYFCENVTKPSELVVYESKACLFELKNILNFFYFVFYMDN